jgi:hypothetical protein
VKIKKEKELIASAAPSSIQTAQLLGLPINDPKRELTHYIHRDGDVETTLEAIAVDKQITALAKARGVEVDEALAIEAMSGLQHGNNTQSTMARYVEKARGHEAVAADMARASLDSAVAAEETAKSRLTIPNEEITHPKLGRGTRAQFELMHDELQHAAAARESAGMYDHHDDPPRPWVRHGVEAVVALSEAMLVTRRLANASWVSPSTMLLFIALSLILFLGVMFVTRGVGEAIADYREMRSAAHDLTAVATDDGGVA